jgi:HEAT repeat protein
VPALESACRDPDPAVAGAAARALGALREGGPALRALARRAEGALALPALEALAALDDPSDDELFVAAAAHRDPEVVKAAIAALGRRPRAACAEVVRGALAHPRWDVRLAAEAARSSK